MHTLKALHNELKKACPLIHQKRLAILMLATQALLIGQRLFLTQLGRRLASKALVKHNIKRIDRLLGNRHLHQEQNSINKNPRGKPSRLTLDFLVSLESGVFTSIV